MQRSEQFDRMVIKCAICDEGDKKYKCKTCEVPYCSVACYKKHQETPCSGITPLEPQRKQDRQPQRTLLYTTIDTVDADKMELLRHSNQLKNLLYNPHLRRLLEEIDSAPSARKAIRLGMMEPLFVEFADECLKVIEPPDAM
ncbi:zinc finger HIT domain-containing protein 3 [Topomyia yanbarensis]|uniref:zinc finger HIT domain-containing protein 3 n=1 Tax=Topomyia yanbarensis TaxID=2498891 RepID=UPI00273B96A6|nr:zinc finger HIT domain-containing protein 3 [Topomyia yanbarensis]